MTQKLEFKKIHKPVKKDQVFVHLMFAGGDADTEHPESFQVKNLKFKDKDGDIIQKIIEDYKLLKKIIDVNSIEFSESYSEVEKKYGKDMAKLFDNTPNDPQNDYQNKCYLDDMKIVAYDEDGIKYEAYVNLYK